MTNQRAWGSGLLVVSSAVCGSVFLLAPSVAPILQRTVEVISPVSETLVRGVSWPLLIVVSLIVRKFLIEYVGDVAAYITPFKLNEFEVIRAEIKKCVTETARAVYAVTNEEGTDFAYEQVVVVGHSLGSVISYDLLNRLINEDELTKEWMNRTPVGGTPPATGDTQNVYLDVLRRTRCFLSFGSPLDKIAFLFALQGRETSEAREALATTLQPLIQKPAYRQLRWINLYSRWDLISGNLKFYDLPDRTSPNPVDNREDAEATTFLSAHTEYWGNPQLFEILHQTLLP